MKGLRVIKIVKGITFEGLWGELESIKDFQRQSVTKYLRITLVFMRNSTQRENFNFCFSKVFG